MRLLIFLDTDHLSGPARLALDFAVEARELGHEVLMLGLFRGPRLAPTRFSEAMAAAGLPVRMLHERFRFDPGVVRQFRRVLAEFRPDLYQSHGYKGSLLGRVARRRGVLWQAIFHGLTWENWRVRFYHWLDLRWLRAADEVIVVSREFERALSKKGIKKDRLFWVPNAISEKNLKETDSGVELRSEWFDARSGQVLVVGVVGRFSPEKGPDLFLRAFSCAALSRPELRAVMVGDGPLLAACRALAVELGVGERVLFPGFRPDLASIYKALDVLVIPSRSEGLPTVLIEAMLLRVPVVSTRVGAVPDVVRDGAEALLVPVGDVAGLAAALVRIAADEALRGRLAEESQKLARKRLNVHERTRTLIGHAQCLLAGEPLFDIPGNE